MPSHTARAGITGHTQSIVGSGGPNGGPQALWENRAKRTAIQNMLNGGDIELFVMTAPPMRHRKQLAHCTLTGRLVLVNSKCSYA